MTPEQIADEPWCIPLTPFERLMLENNAPEHPMIYRIVVRLTGECDFALLSETYDYAVSRHPLLRSCVRKQRGRYCWVPAPHRSLQTDASDTSDVADVFQSQNADEGWVLRGTGKTVIPNIDLTAESGIRSSVIRRPGLTLIQLDIHHSVSDGNGIRQFFTEWLSVYHCRMTQTPVRLRLLDSALIHRRGAMPHLPAGPEVGFFEGIRNLVHTVRGRTVRFPEHGGSASRNNPATYCTERIVSGNQLSLLTRRLSTSQVTVNDFMTAACMYQLNRLQPNSGESDRITILNPVDMRLPGDRYMSAANRVGFAFLRRRRPECQNFEQLLTSIRGELLYIKKHRVGGEFIRGLALADRIPLGIYLARKIRLFHPTAQVTCLGDVTKGARSMLPVCEGRFVAGNLRVESITGFPPIGPEVPFSIAVCLSPGTLTFTVRSSMKHVTEELTEQFADQLFELLTDDDN